MLSLAMVDRSHESGDVNALLQFRCDGAVSRLSQLNVCDDPLPALRGHPGQPDRVACASFSDRVAAQLLTEYRIRRVMAAGAPGTLRSTQGGLSTPGRRRRSNRCSVPDQRSGELPPLPVVGARAWRRRVATGFPLPLPMHDLHAQFMLCSETIIDHEPCLSLEFC